MTRLVLLILDYNSENISGFSVQYIESSEIHTRIPDRSDWKNADQVEKKIDEVEEDDEESGKKIKKCGKWWKLIEVAVESV